MKFLSKLKLIVGVLLVLLVAAGLFLYLDFSMSRKTAQETYLQADSFTVGVDYSGIVEKQFVDDGDVIKSGDRLFEVRSSTLEKAIEDNDVARGSLLYSTTESGTVDITSAADGKVQKVDYRAGSFVPANNTMATINNENALYAQASFLLTSPDYARLSKQSKLEVVLPDSTKIDARIYDITLDKSDDGKEVLTTIRAKIDPKKVNTEVFAVGTPLESTLYLDTETWYSRIVEYAKKLFEPGQ